MVKKICHAFFFTPLKLEAKRHTFFFLMWSDEDALSYQYIYLFGFLSAYLIVCQLLNLYSRFLVFLIVLADSKSWQTCVFTQYTPRRKNIHETYET